MYVNDRWGYFQSSCLVDFITFQYRDAQLGDQTEVHWIRCLVDDLMQFIYIGLFLNTKSINLFF